MTDPDVAHLAANHTLGDQQVPAIVTEVAAGDVPELIWRNQLDGLTFRIGHRFIKWNPRTTGVDLDLERQRLGWLADRHPAPTVLDYGFDDDAQWLVTRALDGDSAVGNTPSTVHG